jgi:uncharacterized damage-inducible protein DinB
MDSARFAELFEWEKDSNRKMLGMIESVPEAMRTDARFAEAVRLAAHVVACRENWLNRIVGQGDRQGLWFEDDAVLEGLRERFEAMEKRWAEYLESATDESLAGDFSFVLLNGNTYSLPIEIQVLQLLIHTPYHRGQVALLVDQLGGETVDTDFLYWFFKR